MVSTLVVVFLTSFAMGWSFGNDAGRSDGFDACMNICAPDQDFTLEFEWPEARCTPDPPEPKQEDVCTI